MRNLITATILVLVLAPRAMAQTPALRAGSAEAYNSIVRSQQEATRRMLEAEENEARKYGLSLGQYRAKVQAELAAAEAKDRAEAMARYKAKRYVANHRSALVAKKAATKPDTPKPAPRATKPTAASKNRQRTSVDNLIEIK